MGRAAYGLLGSFVLAAACQRPSQPVEPPVLARRVSFPTSDGGLIVADEYGAGAHAVVLAPGGRFDKESWAPQARALAGAGFRVLAIDFRWRGGSRGGVRSPDPYDGLHLDVLGAVRHLRETGAERVSVVGGSLGGSAAARAAVEAGRGERGEAEEIDRLVLLAHGPIEEPERLRGRKLFVVARDDPWADGSPRLPAIREQYERAPEPKELLILEGAAHAQHLFATEQGAGLMREILRFLSDP